MRKRVETPSMPSSTASRILVFLNAAGLRIGLFKAFAVIDPQFRETASSSRACEDATSPRNRAKRLQCLPARTAPEASSDPEISFS